MQKVLKLIKYKNDSGEEYKGMKASKSQLYRIQSSQHTRCNHYKAIIYHSNIISILEKRK